MSRKQLIFILLCSTLITLTGLSTMAGAQQYHTLPNGMQIVISQDQRFPLVSLRLYVRAGSAYELPGEEGISHFVEHMVFKGTDRRGPGQVAREIEEVGGYLNAATSFDYTVFIIDLPAKEWALGLDILQDMIFGSTFDPYELTQEKSVVLAEIQRAKDNPGSRIFQSIQSIIFEHTPYEHPILGFKETVQEFEGGDLKNYVSRMYQPGSMVLSVSGDIEPEKILDLSGELFGGLTNKHTDTAPVPLELFIRNRPADRRINVEQGPWAKTYMAMAVPAPEIGSPGTAAFDVLAYLLGGDKTSLLYREFQYEHGLVDQISTRVLSLERTGLFYFYADMDPDHTETFWNKFMLRLSSLSQEDFSKDQIRRAVTNIEEGLFRSEETLGGIASKLGFNQLIAGDPRAEEKYLYKLNRVTREDLQEIIDNYLCPGNFALTVLTPEHAALPGEIFADSLEKAVLKDLALDKDIHDDLEETEIIDLGLGRKMVLIHDRHLPYASLNIVWPGGNSLITPDRQGVPELSAGVLTRETTHRSYEKIQEFLRDRASSINASASRDSFSLSARYPARYSSDILELVSEIVLSPAFSMDELKRQASSQISDIRQQEDRPLGYAFRHLFPFLFSSGSYGYLHLGEENFIREATVEMVRSFWEKQLALPFVIAVCGSIDRQAVENLAESLSRIGTREIETAPDFTWSEDRIKDVVLRDRTQAHMLMIFPVAGRKHEHAPGLNVMNKVLAGQGGILFRELRDRRGLAYSVTSLLWQTPDIGFLALYIGTYEDRMDEAAQGFEKVIANLRSETVEEDDVNRAANLIFGEYHRNRQTISSRAGEAASLFVQNLDLDFNLRLTEKAGLVTPEELRMLAVEYLDPEKSYLMRILPR